MISPHAPAILTVEIWSQILPAFALLTRRNLSRPVVIVALAFVGSWVMDGFARYIAHQTGNNLWVSTLSAGLVFVALLVALADWQVTVVERLTVRISIIPCLIVYGVLVVFVEDISGYSRFAYPFYLLVILGASAWTLLRRSYRHPGTPIFETDWFLILGGLALSAATTLVSTPVGAVLLTEQRIDLLTRVWVLRAACTIVAILLITAGTLRRPSETPA